MTAPVPHSLPADCTFMLHQVTPANASHTVPATLRLIKALALFEKAPEEVEATEELLRQSFFGDDQGRKYAEAVLVYKGGAPGEEGAEAVALACYYFTFSTVLEDLFVEESYRGQGLARMLFRHLGQICAERKLPRMEWVYIKWNENAERVYKKMGAADLDEWMTMRLTGPALAALAK
ncbi:hypothetical protein JCM10450v2_001180 [Rhodotorula kratochvilovae]